MCDNVIVRRVVVGRVLYECVYKEDRDGEGVWKSYLGCHIHVNTRKNRGEPINLYRLGPPPHFTDFFSELMILTTLPTLLQKRGFPWVIGKKRKTHEQNKCTVYPRSKNLVMDYTGSFFDVMGPQELKTRTH